MVDATFSEFTSERRSEVRTPPRRLFSKSSGAAGAFVATVLVALKVLALAEEKGWTLYLDDWAANFTQISAAQWPAVMVILIEALVAGAAVSIVYSYTVNHISQTVQNIWQRLEKVGPDPGTLLVDEDTRSWVSNLTVRDFRVAQERVAEQELQIQRMQEEAFALRAEQERMKAEHAEALERKDREIATRNQQLTAAEAIFARFQQLADDTKKLRGGA